MSFYASSFLIGNGNGSLSKKITSTKIRWLKSFVCQDFSHLSFFWKLRQRVLAVFYAFLCYSCMASDMMQPPLAPWRNTSVNWASSKWSPPMA